MLVKKGLLMNIDSINKAMTNGLGSSLATQKRNKSRKRTSSDNMTAIRAKAQSIIRRAMEMEDASPAAIEKARLLVESGKLDSMENIESTVRKILRYGF